MCGAELFALSRDHVHDAIHFGFVSEKADAVCLLGISGHKRKKVKEVNSTHPGTQVGHRLLRRGESLIMKLLDDVEA
jgi:hypothetical protein